MLTAVATGVTSLGIYRWVLPSLKVKIMDNSIIFIENKYIKMSHISEVKFRRVLKCFCEYCADNKLSLKKYGADAVSVVAFTYDIYTSPSKNNGALRPTLTNNATPRFFAWLGSGGGGCRNLLGGGRRCRFQLLGRL